MEKRREGEKKGESGSRGQKREAGERGAEKGKRRRNRKGKK
jgi:hypothetical protein